MIRRLVPVTVLVAALLAGTLTDVTRPVRPQDPTLLAVDFHVHASPGDGLLPVWEIQREAARRGLDVIAITNHNHNLASRIARALGLVGKYPIVIDGQELTTPAFHIAAVGATQLIDWRLPAVEAIAAIHEAGGIAIAAHPGPDSWSPANGDAARTLDGVEVAHPSVFEGPSTEQAMRTFFESARRQNPEIAPIGSSDFHFAAPLGVCRTYASVTEPSRDAVLDAVRHARTGAVCRGQRVTGAAAIVARVGERLSAEPAGHFGYGLSTWIAITTLLALAVISLSAPPR